MNPCTENAKGEGANLRTNREKENRRAQRKDSKVRVGVSQQCDEEIASKTPQLCLMAGWMCFPAIMPIMLAIRTCDLEPCFRWNCLDVMQTKKSPARIDKTSDAESHVVVPFVTTSANDQVKAMLKTNLSSRCNKATDVELFDLGGDRDKSGSQRSNSGIRV